MTITCDLIYWITWCKIWMLWCWIQIVLLCRWPRSQESYGIFQEIQWQYDLHLEMFWTHQSTIDEQENFTIDGYLYLASLLTLLEITLIHGDVIEFRHNGYHGHIYPLSRRDITRVFHYKCKIIRARLFKITWTLVSARWRWEWDVIRLRCFDDFEGVPDQCLRLDLRFRNWLRNDMPRFNSLRLASIGFTSWIDYYQWHPSPGLCVLPLTERIFFITSWIFDNSQLAGTERILMEWPITSMT